MTKHLKFTASIVMVLVLGASTTTKAQVFTDTDFLASDYVTNSNIPANTDIRFNVDYSNIDVFGDQFLLLSLPEAPRTPGGAAATTGVFLTANHDTFNAASGQETFAAVMPTSANVNVGAGTATPNYKVTVDVFHSSAAGFDDGAGGVSQTGSTNYSMVGINQQNTTVQINELNAPGTGGGLSGQGFGLAVTADTGASDDYLARYGGALYVDRDLGEEPGQFYSQATILEGGSVGPGNGVVSSGLLGRHLNDYWEAQGLGFEFTDSDGDVTNNLNRFTGNATTFAPDPNDLDNYYTGDPGSEVLTTIVQPLLDAFPENTGPLHYSCGNANNCSLAAGQSLAGNDALFPGVPYNAWATHELYWVDEQFTYVIDGTPVLQFTPDDDGLGNDDNIFNDYSDAGTVVLAFWDRFGGSISINPEGANFVVYDNLTVESATSAEVPSLLGFLASGGYLLDSGSNVDADDDGDVDGADFLLLQRNDPSLIPAWEAAFGTTGSPASAVPEPASAVLLISLFAATTLRRSSLR